MLGDISNQHRNRQLSPGTGLGASVKKQCVEPKDVKTPTTTKSALSQSITKPVVTKSHAEEIEVRRIASIVSIRPKQLKRSCNL